MINIRCFPPDLFESTETGVRRDEPGEDESRVSRVGWQVTGPGHSVTSSCHQSYHSSHNSLS